MASSAPSERRADDSPLVRAFFEKRENLLLFLAARTRCMATAEDLVQDLYLRIAALEADADVRAPAALLYKMASNLLIDHVRSHQRSARRNAEWRQEGRVVVGREEVVDELPADELLVSKNGFACLRKRWPPCRRRWGGHSVCISWRA